LEANFFFFNKTLKKTAKFGSVL